VTISLSHHTKSEVELDSLNDRVDEIESRIQQTESLFLPKKKTLSLLHQLTEFPLGRFLLQNKGLNGYWTAYIFRNRTDHDTCHPLEKWLLTRSLYVMARERFYVFQKEIKQSLFPGISMASLPCGIMDDLLHLDYNGLEDFKLTGIDYDEESLHFAKLNAAEQNLADKTTFILKDAWQLDIEEAFDLLTSNGLNMYESSPQRLVDLYKNFAKALVKGGKLLLSFIPPPPKEGLKGISEEDFMIERALFGDIIQINYLNFSSEEEITQQLNQSGFDVEHIIYNQYGVAPVLVAYKR